MSRWKVIRKMARHRSDDVKRVAAAGCRLPARLPNGEILTDIRLNKWRLGDSIGWGGFGDIYLGENYYFQKKLTSIKKLLFCIIFIVINLINVIDRFFEYSILIDNYKHLCMYRKAVYIYIFVLCKFLLNFIQSKYFGAFLIFVCLKEY